MRKLIEHLRGRPEAHRHAVAFGVSFLVTLVIAGIWATTTFPLTRSTSQTVAQNEAAKTSQVQGPVSTFGRNVAQTFGALKGQLGALGTYFSETSYEAQPTLIVVPPSDSVVNY